MFRIPDDPGKAVLWVFIFFCVCPPAVYLAAAFLPVVFGVAVLLGAPCVCIWALWTKIVIPLARYHRERSFEREQKAEKEKERRRQDQLWETYQQNPLKPLGKQELLARVMEDQAETLAELQKLPESPAKKRLIAEVEKRGRIVRLRILGMPIDGERAG